MQLAYLYQSRDKKGKPMKGMWEILPRLFIDYRDVTILQATEIEAKHRRENLQM